MSRRDDIEKRLARCDNVAEFIAHAPRDIRWLLDELDEALKSRDSWRAESRRVHAELSELHERLKQ